MPGAVQKMSVQHGRSFFCARTVPCVREHGKMARTLLTAFFNSAMLAMKLPTMRERMLE